LLKYFNLALESEVFSLSESTIYADPSILESVNYGETPNRSVIENENSWDRELFVLVAENADMPVKLSIMGGAEMTLSEAMWHIPINEDNVHEVITVVHQLLASTEIEAEPPEEGYINHENETAQIDDRDEVVNEESVQVQAEEPRKNDAEYRDNHAQEIQIVDTTQDSHRLRVDVEPRKQPKNIAAEPLKTPDTNTINTAVAEPIKAEPRPAAKDVPIIETFTTAVKTTADVLSPDSPKASEAAVMSGEIANEPVQETNNKSGQEPISITYAAKESPRYMEPAAKLKVELSRPVPAEIGEADAAANSFTEINSPYAYSRPDKEHEIESFILPLKTEIVAEPDLLSDLPEVSEIAAAATENTELTDENIQFTAGGTELDLFEYQAEPIAATEFVENETAPVNYLKSADEERSEQFLMPVYDVGEAAAEAEEAYTAAINDKPDLLKQVEPAHDVAERFTPINIQVEEIEHTLIQLAERIKEGSPEEAGKADENLTKIIETAAKFEEQSGDTIIAETGIQEELEELFTELLENAGINAPPELVESLAYLTVKYHLAKEIKKLNNEEVLDDLPQDTGTHESIMQLLLSFGSIKKSLEQVWVIGKSALQLSLSQS
jgi:hypothetical protein